MDFSDPRQRQAFFAVHDGLPRQAPGGRRFSARALALTELPATARILDVGCGPGAQTVDLAQLLPAATLIALDLYRPFLGELRARATRQGCAHQIHAVCGDMAAMPFADNSFDLIWSEGAAYSIGLPAALSAWRPLLKPRGYLAFTDNIWLGADAPAAIRAWWQAEYPGMQDRQGCLNLIEEAGYKCLGDFVLPAEAWWDEYYTPMQQRVSAQQAVTTDAVALDVLAEIQQEIDNHRAYSEHYSYAFFVLQRCADEQITT